MNKEYPVLFDNKTYCCGCSACYSICPQDAISMVEDDEGFEYPIIDKNICLKCYACINVCPIKRIHN